MPKLVPLAEARSLALTRYFTGKPCKKGHVDLRHTASMGCMTCRREAEAAYLERNRNAYINRKRARYARNREAEKEKMKALYWRNVDARREYSREYYRSDPEQGRARSAQWAQKNPERHKENARIGSHRRRARLKATDGTFTREDIRTLLRAQNGRCAYCKTGIRKCFRIDHIIPIAKGGSNWPSNLQLTCDPCNRRKGAKLPEDFARELGLLL